METGAKGTAVVLSKSQERVTPMERECAYVCVFATEDTVLRDENVMRPSFTLGQALPLWHRYWANWELDQSMTNA